jgi:GxxExxY protein
MAEGNYDCADDADTARSWDTLGYGFREPVYSRALAIELKLRGLRVDREVPATVFYAGEVVGRYRIDHLVEGRLVLEIKAGRSLVSADRDQLLNALKSTNLELGLLFHFGPKPTFCRMIAESRPGSWVSASSAQS